MPTRTDTRRSDGTKADVTTPQTAAPDRSSGMPTSRTPDVLPVDKATVAALVVDVLDRPAAEGARIIALQWLLQLVEMRKRWRILAGRPGNEAASDHQEPDAAAREVLHKSRVALRRLRAILREHRQELKGASNPRIDRALRSLGRRTNALRDRDVHIAWLDAEKDALREPARTEAQRLREHLMREETLGISRVDDLFERHLDDVSDELGRRLSWYTRRARLGDDTSIDAPYALSVASRLRNGLRRINRDLELIGVDGDSSDTLSARALERIHNVRLRMKRHRAMLAPLERVNHSLAALYELETRGQDLLGAMRDADMLAGIARDSGYEALSAVLAGVRLSNMSAFLAQWVKRRDEVDRTFARALEWLEHRQAVGSEDERRKSEKRKFRNQTVTTNREGTAADLRARDALDGRDGRVSDTMGTKGAHADRYLLSDEIPMEIERKFLLNGVPPEALAMPPIAIEQGWIPGARLQERLRRSRYPDGSIRCTRTIKLGRPEARVEIEEDTGNAIFQAMWALTTSARIRKHRHVLRDERHTWEIDVFSDRDLVLAEVELDALDEHVTVPSWLESYIVREVTGETAYTNSQMARPELSPDTAMT